MSPKHLMRLVALGSLLSAATCLPPTSAMAQAAAGSNSVWRCGDGRYSSAPCPGGVALDAADPRSAEQRAQSGAAVAADKRQAEQLAAERKAREVAGGSPKAVNLSASTAAPAAAAASANKADARGKGKPKRAKKVKKTQA